MSEQIAVVYRAVHQVLPDAEMVEIRRAIAACGIDATIRELVEDIIAGREAGIYTSKARFSDGPSPDETTV